MKNLTIIAFIFMLLFTISCNNKTTKENTLTQAQKDSIEKVKQDSIATADSIAKEKKRVADSIRVVEKAERERKIATLSKKFRVSKDEFSDRAWVYHLSTPKYTNRNSIHLYFEKTGGVASNLRFRVQYESDDWLFIQNIIFNIDGDNITFYPSDMERDNNSRIWEWCDEPASRNSVLVTQLAHAQKVKIKFNGEQYYNTRTLSQKELTAIKETYEYFKLLGGSL